MKLIGFILIVFSSVVCGFNYTETKKNRLEELASFSFMLELMVAELNTSLPTLPELIKKLETKLDNKALCFVKVLSLNLAMLGEKDFNSIWCNSLSGCDADLTEQEYDSIASLGSILGKYDVETQGKALNECLVQFRASEHKLKEELPQLKRLSLGVSMSAGAILAIMLV